MSGLVLILHKSQIYIPLLLDSPIWCKKRSTRIITCDTLLKKRYAMHLNSKTLDERKTPTT